MKRWFFWAFMILVLLDAKAQETQIMIRAKAKDAKFIGTSIGGAHILVRDALSGTVLTEGFTFGSTGKTDLIMKKPVERRSRISDEKTGGFLAKLDIKEPRLITIEAHSPAQVRQASVLTSTQVWAIPGKHILGDGIVLEVPGFIVDILSPFRHQTLENENLIEVKANIVMMCGCPITKGGLWNAEDYEVKVLIVREDQLISETPLEFSGETNIFKNQLKLSPGFYTLVVYAYDAITGNTGVDKTSIRIN